VYTPVIGFRDTLAKSKPTVSVIIPAYNGSGTLRLALQTVLWQDFTDFEVWVIGDGCVDDSENVVASFRDDRVHWMNLPSNSGGPSLPREKGLRHANGQYIAYIGQDDLWFPWHLSELVCCIETSNSNFAYSLGAIMGPGGIIGTFSLSHELWSPSEFISPINWLHTKNLFDVIGSWATFGKYGDDREFLRRLFDANVSLEFRRQLTVLKFPAAMWHMYSIKKDFPQTRYVKAIYEDATKLRNELLLEFAAFASIRHEPSSPLYTRVFSYSIDRLIRTYGLHRWPVNLLLYRRYRQLAGLNGSS